MEFLGWDLKFIKHDYVVFKEKTNMFWEKDYEFESFDFSSQDSHIYTHTYGFRILSKEKEPIFKTKLYN